MRYKEAIKIKQLNSKLIGTYSEKGFMIDDIIIVPTKAKYRNEFFKTYLAGQSIEPALKLLKNEDVQVWAIDKKYLHESNVLFFNNINH